MDVSVRVFFTPEEFIELLEVASAQGGSILYHVTVGAPYCRVEQGSPLPDELLRLLRAPWTFDSNHRHFITPGGTGADPDAIPPNKIISAYFGGIDARALYITSVSARSNDDQTLGLMRRLARWARARSTTGIEAWGEPVEPGNKGVVARGDRYSQGALCLVQSGLQLRQRGVAHVHYRIPADAAAVRPTALDSKPVVRSRRRP